MYQAVWQEKVIAKSDKTIEVEGNQYFPMMDVNMDLLSPTDHTTVCPWKGTASYYTLTTNDEKNENAAWMYKDPKEAASQIKDYIAFWKGVEVQKI